MKEQQRPGIPLPTIKRIPVYVSVLEKRLKEGKETVSTTDFAAALALKPVQVRKDLAFAGAEGKPRIGYRTEELLETLHRFVGWNNLSEAVLVGAGALGTAILGYKGFDRFGLKIKAAFDIDETKCGAPVHDKPVYPIRDLKQYVKKNGIIMGILTVSENGVGKRSTTGRRRISRSRYSRNLEFFSRTNRCARLDFRSAGRFGCRACRFGRPH